MKPSVFFTTAILRRSPEHDDRKQCFPAVEHHGVEWSHHCDGLGRAQQRSQRRGVRAPAPAKSPAAAARCRRRQVQSSRQSRRQEASRKTYPGRTEYRGKSNRQAAERRNEKTRQGKTKGRRQPGRSAFYRCRWRPRARARTGVERRAATNHHRRLLRGREAGTGASGRIADSSTVQKGGLH